MDEPQDRLVRVGLEVLGGYGFVLARGYALQAHELVERMSEDVDLFTDRWDPNEFSRAIDAVSEAYRGNGFEVTVVRRAETFARLQVGDPREGRLGSVDLAADMRRHEPARLSVGPVLAELDAVAAKVATVFSRGEARDYLDLAGILDSGRFTPEELMSLASSVDGGFSRGIFAEALAAIDRFPDEEFAGYGVDPARISRVREMVRDWSRALQGEAASGPVEQEPTRSTTTPPEVGSDASRAEDANRARDADAGAVAQPRPRLRHPLPGRSSRPDLGPEPPSQESPSRDL